MEDMVSVGLGPLVLVRWSWSVGLGPELAE